MNSAVEGPVHTGPVHTVHSVRITLDPITARATSQTGKKSWYPELHTSGIAHIQYQSGTAEDNIQVSFADHGVNRDVYFGKSVRLGDVAFKIQHAAQTSTKNEKNLVDQGFTNFAVTVWWFGHSSLGLPNAADDEYSVLLERRGPTVDEAMAEFF